MRELKQTAGARDTRAWRERKKRGEWVVRVRFDQNLMTMLRDCGLVYSWVPDNAAIERAVHDLIGNTRTINLKQSADRKSFTYTCNHGRW
jgi:hypothetical protein